MILITVGHGTKNQFELNEELSHISGDEARPLVRKAQPAARCVEWRDSAPGGITGTVLPL